MTLTRLALALVSLMLSAAAFAGIFDPMTEAEQTAMLNTCLKSPACRAYYEAQAYGPAELDALRNEQPGCLQHALMAEQRAWERDIGPTCMLTGLVDPKSHKGCAGDQCAHVTLMVEWKGEPWIVDNGALRSCNRVCRASQITHEFEVIRRASYGERCP
jgi:hypothetical protein